MAAEVSKARAMRALGDYIDAALATMGVDEAELRTDMFWAQSLHLGQHAAQELLFTWRVTHSRQVSGDEPLPVTAHGLWRCAPTARSLPALQRRDLCHRPGRIVAVPQRCGASMSVDET